MIEEDRRCVLKCHDTHVISFFGHLFPSTELKTKHTGPCRGIAGLVSVRLFLDRRYVKDLFSCLICFCFFTKSHTEKTY